MNPEDDESDEDRADSVTIGGKAEVTLILTNVENEEQHESDTRPQTVRFGVKSKNK